MNTCKDYKWWKPGVWDDHPASGGKMKQCTHRKLFPKGDKVFSGSDTLIDLGSDAGYQDLYTGPDFGCIHHEPK